MKHIKLLALALSIVFATACKDNKKETETEMETEVEETMENEKVMSKELSFKLTPKSDSNVSGKVEFKQKGNKVTMSAKMSGLTPGTHAIHIHAEADCSSPDGTSTGGHWNPTAQPHGKWGDEAGYHKGDIGNFEVGEDGTGNVLFSTDQWCIGCGDETKDILGKAIIVHQGTDDFTSQPSGAAGSRVSCGGIIE
ncbi:superoxide dismutase family protein [Winogradskyella ouciana]|uniref:Superoxide dismutase family protein n=1 Tax=Winogradskyella ouciana TaxID=2608631 RepID=A0A7K1GDN8_9FLAO|nr:superoxide dismutase family protein [Winogradskyella ouciana]MTE27422.1 superoxide dismutase family protein [Winogradskyella ouciana]